LTTSTKCKASQLQGQQKVWHLNYEDECACLYLLVAAMQMTGFSLSLENPSNSAISVGNQKWQMLIYFEKVGRHRTRWSHSPKHLFLGHHGRSYERAKAIIYNAPMAKRSTHHRLNCTKPMCIIVWVAHNPCATQLQANWSSSMHRMNCIKSMCIIVWIAYNP
jgi:hypothetical protein